MFSKKEKEKRRLLSQLNVCAGRGCSSYRNKMCTNLKDSVNENTGVTICPKEKDAILRINFTG